MTFHYNSTYWSNKLPFNIDGGGTGFDLQETKMPTYWATSFSKLCLGMRVGEVTKWAGLNYTASSLYSVLANGTYKRTYLGRSAWKSLIDGSSLQDHCNKEGFNSKSQLSHWRKEWDLPAAARIGILGDDQHDVSCMDSESRLGFGTKGNLARMQDSNTCGNEAGHNSSDNGLRHTKAHCYIPAQWNILKAKKTFIRQPPPPPHPYLQDLRNFVMGTVLLRAWENQNQHVQVWNGCQQLERNSWGQNNMLEGSCEGRNCCVWEQSQRQAGREASVTKGKQVMFGSSCHLPSLQVLWQQLRFKHRKNQPWKKLQEKKDPLICSIRWPFKAKLTVCIDEKSHILNNYIMRFLWRDSWGGRSPSQLSRIEIESE